MNDWDDVSDAIAEAQKCIFDLSEREVAQDIIEVSVAGQQCVDPTLIDLPGIVRTVGTGERESPASVILLLINKVLRNERCIILAVVPANFDFHSSQACIIRGCYALGVDTETRRIIPVVTKPDLIDAGAEQAMEDHI